MSISESAAEIQFNPIAGVITIHAERVLNVIIITLVWPIDQICFASSIWAWRPSQPGRIKVGKHSLRLQAELEAHSNLASAIKQPSWW